MDTIYAELISHLFDVQNMEICSEEMSRHYLMEWSASYTADVGYDWFTSSILYLVYSKPATDAHQEPPDFI